MWSVKSEEWSYVGFSFYQHIVIFSPQFFHRNKAKAFPPFPHLQNEATNQLNIIHYSLFIISGVMENVLLCDAGGSAERIGRYA